MSQPLAIELAPSLARTAAGAGVAVDLGLVANTVPRSAARLDAIEVSAFSGLERMRLVIEHAAASSGPWLELDALEVEQTGDYELSVGDAKRWLRVRWELFGDDGSPSVTFGVQGEAHQVYVGPRGLKSAIREPALSDMTTATARADACIAASDEADGYLGGAFTLPLLAWDNTLSAKCAHLAIKYALDACGWQPEGPDNVLLANYTAAIRWMEKLQKRQLTPPGMVDSTPGQHKNNARVARIRSTPRRGWDC
jgi:phage gp36-like protein